MSETKLRMENDRMRAFSTMERIGNPALARSSHSHSLPHFMLNGTVARMEYAVASILDTSPVARIERRKNGFSVVPNGGGISITVQASTGRSFFVAFGGWSDYFEDDATVLRLISKALTGRLRVVNTLKGSVIHSHALEILLREGGWCQVAELTYMRFSLLPRPLTRTTDQYPLRNS